MGDSVGEILEEIGLEYTGAPGTTAALAMLNDLRKFCTDKELETLDMITNMVSMMETYETIFA